tara:strand:- start:17683 stop:17883 length:201 start_codon:yes stop_codon:yes gene_type:complete
MTPATTKQGHLYFHGDAKVIALESGASPEVRQIDPDAPLCMGHKYKVRAEWLTPAPMKYFRGEVPR